MFEYVSNDERLLSIYYKIDEMNETTNFTWAHHGYNHIMNVCNIALGIMKQLHYDEELIDAIMTAIFMHDLGCVAGKSNHNIRSYEIAKEYFENEKINSKYIDDILLSIKYHNNYRYLNNKIAPVLRFVDKLDHTKERVTNAGKSVKGMKEYLYIEKIIIDINDKQYYIAGDTDNIEEIQNIECDIACIPIGGTYTMNYQEAADLANNITAKMIIPTHYGSIVGNKEDAMRFKELVNGKEVKILI